MPDIGWISEYDDCLFFDNEEDARCIGHGKLTAYIKRDTVSAAVREAVDWIEKVYVSSLGEQRSNCRAALAALRGLGDQS
jgi:hypothetical protein